MEKVNNNSGMNDNAADNILEKLENIKRLQTKQFFIGIFIATFISILVNVFVESKCFCRK